MRQCKRCAFRNDQDICVIKGVYTCDVDYENCWFFRYWNTQNLEYCTDYDDIQEDE